MTVLHSQNSPPHRQSNLCFKCHLRLYLDEINAGVCIFRRCFFGEGSYFSACLVQQIPHGLAPTAGFSYGSLVTGIWKRFYWKLERHLSLLFPPSSAAARRRFLGGGRVWSRLVPVHAPSPSLSPGGRSQPAEKQLYLPRHSRRLSA